MAKDKKKVKDELPAIEMKFGDLNTQGMVRILQKLNNSDVSAITASRFRKIVKAVMDAQEVMEKVWKEKVWEPYKEKFLAGTGIDLGLYDGQGAEDRDDAGLKAACDALDEEKTKIRKQLEADVKKEKEAFDATPYTFRVLPLAPQHLAEIRVSARDIEVLGPLYDEDGEVRTAAMKTRLGVVPN